MKPFDVRLLRASKAIWVLLILGALWALLQTTGMVLFAWCATELVVGMFGNSDVAWPLLLSGVLVGALLRASAVWGMSSTSARGAAKVKADLRDRGMRAVQTGGGQLVAGNSRADTTLLLGRGLDALDDYFGSYLPQLILVIIMTPLLWLAILSQDVESAITIAIVIPVIPVFMILIGMATKATQADQWAALSSLARQFLDLVDGLSTLKIFRRERAQATGIRLSGDEYRVRSMKVLRLSFLSGFVLELAATLSVALVAVFVGTRLVVGELTLSVGLFVLLLVPDVFGPIRQVGASFHSSAEGLTASQQLFDLEAQAQLIDSTNRELQSETAEPETSLAQAAAKGVMVRDLTVWRRNDVIVENWSAHFVPGKIHAVVGASGAGKSTIIAALLGFAASTGFVSVDGLSGVQDRRDRIAWAPQRANLVAGTVASNVALGDSAMDYSLVERALDRAVLPEVSPDFELGAGGSGLSGGQAQRVNVARALYRLEHKSEVHTLILDEPTSALDGDAQVQLVHELRRLADSGVCVIIVSHRDGLVRAADQIWDIGGGAR